MRCTLDRFEGAFAILEDENGELRQIPLSQLPSELHEGAVLEETETGWALCPAAEQARREALQARLRRLKQKNLR